MTRSWFGRGVAIAVVVGVASGLASGLFLIVLRHATNLNAEHPWLLYFLPLIGAGIARLYSGYGKSAAGGNNLILDHIHEPKESGIPLRMFPLILVSTVATHLFGGSAGREGTAAAMAPRGKRTGRPPSWFGLGPAREQSTHRLHRG